MSEMVAYETDHGKVSLTPEIVRRQLVSGNGAVTDQEVGMFLQLCRYQQLNPFLKEAYLIKYGNQDASIVTGKDVFIKRAAKNDQFDGLESGLYLQPKEGGDLIRRTGAMWLPGEKIVGAWAVVHRKDWSHPVEASVSFAEYVGRKRDGEVNSQWSKMPGTMIIKVAEGHALRKAFPADFQGLYNAEEMTQHEEPVERPVADDRIEHLQDTLKDQVKELLEKHLIDEETLKKTNSWIDKQDTIEKLQKAATIISQREKELLAAEAERDGSPEEAPEDVPEVTPDEDLPFEGDIF